MKKILTFFLMALMLFSAFTALSAARADSDWGQLVDGESSKERPDPYEWTYFVEEGKYYRYKTEEGNRNKCVEVDEEEYNFVDGGYRMLKAEGDAADYTDYMLLNIGVALGVFVTGVGTTLAFVKLKKGRKSISEE